MRVEFTPDNTPPVQPKISFDRVDKVDASKFNEIIQPYKKDLEDENKKLEAKTIKYVDGKDPSLMIPEAGLCMLCAIACFIIPIAIPVSGLLAIALLGSGGVFAYSSLSDISTIAFKIQQVQKKIAANSELQEALKSHDFTSLAVFESRKDFHKRLFKRIEQGELTKNDLKALLVLNHRIKNKPDVETDKLVEDLQKEWDTNKRVVDWSRQMKNLSS